MKKRIYITPNAYVCEITGKAIISTSMPVGGTVGDENDIGFVKGENTQIGNRNLWDEEW